MTSGKLKEWAFSGRHDMIVDDIFTVNLTLTAQTFLLTLATRQSHQNIANLIRGEMMKCVFFYYYYYSLYILLSLPLIGNMIDGVFLR